MVYLLSSEDKTIVIYHYNSRLWSPILSYRLKSYMNTIINQRFDRCYINKTESTAISPKSVNAAAYRI